MQALLVVDGTGICYYEGHPSQSKEGAGQRRLGLPQGDGDEDGYNKGKESNNQNGNFR